MKKEIWRFIPGYEGIYMVSNLGRIKRLNYRNTGKERILKLYKNVYGYLYISFKKDNKVKTYAVHGLVFDMFGLEKRNGVTLQIDHIDGNKENNCIENLQLLSARENNSKMQLTKKYKTSRFIGVCWDKTANKWQSNIYINNKLYYLGKFDSEEQASEAYQYALIHQEEIINRPSKKSSKYKGVSWKKNTNKWMASIRIGKKVYYLGSFVLEDDANKAYIDFKEKHNIR